MEPGKDYIMKTYEGIEKIYKDARDAADALEKAKKEFRLWNFIKDCGMLDDKREEFEKETIKSALLYAQMKINEALEEIE